MTASIHQLTFPGPMTQRGFWLYVWRIQYPQGELLYVGRTGDNASPNAASPIKRMGQHLDAKNLGNALRRHLRHQDIEPEDCDHFELIAYGPMFPEETTWTEHIPPRDIMAALEKKLADSLEANHTVMNKVYAKKKLDAKRWEQVREAFAEHFQDLRTTADNQSSG